MLHFIHVDHIPQLCNLNRRVVHFVNSGSKANELAMIVARLYTGNLGMVSLRNAYHGGSSSTIWLTTLNTWKYPISEVCSHSSHNVVHKTKVKSLHNIVKLIVLWDKRYITVLNLFPVKKKVDRAVEIKELKISFNLAGQWHNLYNVLP
ncbi:unnamed protein product [Lupinus luteus]|uniref:Uncharacterized protein n=1 Tax=Lupinus luteus TaxID=3873 RepID=A0AAV1VR62_LUPLU